ncbi:MAG: carboxymuconolactone decarboxylase family protein [Granulosicoccus sp.]|nr:carboxymuconolactone decarboxylase family protein [Granulosicoccus sp.]
MSRLITRQQCELEPQTLEALADVRHKGQLADVYLQFANSEPALRAYLHMEQCIRDGSLTDREIEAVKLWVSQRTGCTYCLSVHTQKARLAGIPEEQQLALRCGHSVDDERLDALIELTSMLFESRGTLDESSLATVRGAGLSDENLVDLTMLISTIFFTNITNHVNGTQSTLPEAPSLE